MQATRADTYTNELKSTKDRQSETTSESSNDMEPEDITQSFQIFEKVSEQIWLSYFWNVFYQRTETNAKQTL